MSADGEVLRNDVTGKVAMKTYLTGMPECKFGINDKILVDQKNRSRAAKSGGGKGGGNRKSVEIEDITFHRCVKLTKFDADRTITFVPPDGEFELMRYRVTEASQPFRLVPSIREEGNIYMYFDPEKLMNDSKHLLSSVYHLFHYFRQIQIGRKY